MHAMLADLRALDRMLREAGSRPGRAGSAPSKRCS